MDKVNKLKKKLDYAFEEKNYYEAHQIYRTIYYRCIASELYKESLELLFEGTLKLIEGNWRFLIVRALLCHRGSAIGARECSVFKYCENLVQEFTSAIDLAELYVETLIKSNAVVSNHTVEAIFLVRTLDQTNIFSYFQKFQLAWKPMRRKKRTLLTVEINSSI